MNNDIKKFMEELGFEYSENSHGKEPYFYGTISPFKTKSLSMSQATIFYLAQQKAALEARIDEINRSGTRLSKGKKKWLSVLEQQLKELEEK